MGSLISVIVPVYNVESYLEKSLTSLLNQTYKNIQIIIIDDGSTDGSGTICDHFCEKDSRIEVYHIPNQGVSNARNQGLDRSKGEYVYFLDPDDFLELRTLEVLYNQIKKDSADLVECSYFKNFMISKESVIHSNAKISSQEAIKSLLLWNGYITSFCWDKLYIREKIGDIRFNPKLKVGEDDVFVFEYLLRCENVSVLDHPLYNYLIRENSAIGNVYTRKKKDSVYAANAIYEICNNQGRMRDEARIHVGLTSFFSYANLLNTVPYKRISEFEDDCKFYVDFMRICSYRRLKDSVGLKTALLYKAAQYCPRLYKMTSFVRKKRR